MADWLLSDSTLSFSNPNQKKTLAATMRKYLSEADEAARKPGTKPSLADFDSESVELLRNKFLTEWETTLQGSPNS